MQLLLRRQTQHDPYQWSLGRCGQTQLNQISSTFQRTPKRFFDFRYLKPEPKHQGLDEYGARAYL